MIPLTERESTYRSAEMFKNSLRPIFSNRNSRDIFLFLLLNLSFAFVELIYGVWTNSLGLISDSFHMLFDCTGLLAGLAASVISRWKPDDKFSYGYGRAEVLAGFVNGLFLIFVSFFIVSEAVERAIEPPEVNHDRLFAVSLMGLIVNLIGIYAFQHAHSHASQHGHSHRTDSHGRSDRSNGHRYASRSSGQSQIMKGVLLHIMADTLGSVGVIVSSLLVQYFGWMRADPICSIFIAILITLSVVPLIRDSALILMQRQPVSLDDVLPQCYQKVMHLAGVYSIQEPHFWALCSDTHVGALKLEVSKAADPIYIMTHARLIFDAAGVKQLYVQLDFADM
ncbi:unnamed protein product [Nesidiocoris tenuis]|uniref:Cation efflux protein transmembrane domain-containing protein n=1 Tax=Nesidiocoris tenuis TaxID=355587 RepID=A0A6H5GFW6_9HEMI|nr:unnamed protein product [Nesidiocoris tenuis]CAB0005093.1 unnamed protein product [Nesidiocoris tenuis]